MLFTFDGVLQALHLDGSTDRQSLGSVGHSAVLSPDGRHVAGVTDAGVRVMRVDTASPVAFVPSGTSVAFAGNRHVAVGYANTADGHDCETEGALFVVDLAAPVPRPVTVAAKPLIVLAASPGSAIVSVPVPDCSDNDVERVALDTGVRTPLPGLWGPYSPYSVDPATGDGWYHEKPSRGFPHGRGIVVSAKNKVVARTTYIDDAAYGPGSAVVYSEPIRTRDLVTKDVILRLGKGTPRPGDRRTHFLSHGDLVWSTTGTAFALRREHPSADFEAAVCTTRDLRCRPVPLRWHDEVDLLGIVPTTHLG